MTEKEQRQAQYEKMTKTPVPRLVAVLAVPTIASMLVSALYNMADTFFVSQLGTSTAGAVGIVFSLMAIIQAIGFTLGMGSGTIVSLHLGAREEDKAVCVASTGFFLALALGALLTVAGSVFIDPLMRLMGATETILPYARDYGKYILLAAPVMCASFVMNNLFRYEGKAILGTIGIGTGGILNIVLDPIFIFGFGLGTAGAAIATAISQLVSFCILLTLFLTGKSDVRLRISKVARNGAVYWNIFRTGLPTLFRQGLSSVATMALNINAALYGDAAVAAMSIVGRIMTFMFSAVLGLGQGFQPVASYNYGAQKFHRVRAACIFTMDAGMVLLTVLAGLSLAGGDTLVRLFRDDDAVTAIALPAFQWQCAATLLQPVLVCSNMLFQSVGKSGRATFLSCCRQGIFFIPLILVLPQVWGLAGVQYSQPIADLLSFMVAVPFVVQFLAELDRMDARVRAGQPAE